MLLRLVGPGVGGVVRVELGDVGVDQMLLHLVGPGVGGWGVVELGEVWWWDMRGGGGGDGWVMNQMLLHLVGPVVGGEVSGGGGVGGIRCGNL